MIYTSVTPDGLCDGVVFVTQLPSLRIHHHKGTSHIHEGAFSAM